MFLNALFYVPLLIEVNNISKICDIYVKGSHLKDDKDIWELRTLCLNSMSCDPGHLSRTLKSLVWLNA